MSLLVETYIFYADVYFAQNFIIKITVLYLTLWWNKKYEILISPKGIGKICVAGAIGTFFEITGLLSEVPYSVFSILMFLGEAPLMLYFILGRNRMHIGKIIVSSYIFTMMINAILEVLWNILGENGNYVGFLMMACGLTVVGISIWKREEKIKKGIYEIELIHAGNQIVTHGFYDSGNRLVDPYTKKGIHIIAEELVQQLGFEINKKVCVPYYSLGEENGMIDVYYIDKVCIYGEKKTIEQTKCPLGITKDNLFKDKKYKMILNEEVF